MAAENAGGLEAILAGMEAALELERELGARSFECDRSLLAAPSASAAPVPPPTRMPLQAPSPAPVPAPVAARPGADGDAYDFVFLHDRKLSAGGEAMMDKIADALCKGLKRAPVVTETPPPAAGIYVVLGSFALKKFFPALRGSPGQWLKTESGEAVLVSNSPEYILRFGEETPAVRKIKQDMWRSLKTVRQRLGLE